MKTNLNDEESFYKALKPFFLYFLHFHSPISAISTVGSKKKPQVNKYLRLSKNGGYLLSHIIAVPSTWTGLTSLFGMGRGGTLSL
jgi:hypothetical protein